MLLPPKWRRVFSVLKPVCQPSQALRHQEANPNYEVVVPSTLSPVLCCFPGTGCPVTETTVIFKVEQGQGPWMVEGENSRWSSPGESEKPRKMGVFEIGVPVGEWGTGTFETLFRKHIPLEVTGCTWHASDIVRSPNDTLSSPLPRGCSFSSSALV